MPARDDFSRLVRHEVAVIDTKRSEMTHRVRRHFADARIVKRLDRFSRRRVDLAGGGLAMNYFFFLSSKICTNSPPAWLMASMTGSNFTAVHSLWAFSSTLRCPAGALPKWLSIREANCPSDNSCPLR